MYKQVKYGSENYLEKIKQSLEEDGVVAIQDFYDKTKCDELMKETYKYFKKINPELTSQNMKKEWTNSKMPPQTKPGLFKVMMSNIPPVWKVRMDENIYNIYDYLYTQFRGEQKDLMVSVDGINVRPGTIGPYKVKDWAHLDQTTRNDKFKCIQGQVVLTNTTASFKCSPKSHLVHDEILDINRVRMNERSNWCLFKEHNIPEIKQKIEEVGEYQIPVKEPAGTLILWLSSTTHAAQLQEFSQEPTKNDSWRGWRGVFYVSMRPKEEYEEKDLNERRMILEKNMSTNHWGIKTPAIGIPKRHASTYSENLSQYVENPEKMYKDFNYDLPWENQHFKKINGFI